MESNKNQFTVTMEGDFPQTLTQISQNQFTVTLAGAFHQNLTTMYLPLKRYPLSQQQHTE